MNNIDDLTSYGAFGAFIGGIFAVVTRIMSVQQFKAQINTMEAQIKDMEANRESIIHKQYQDLITTQNEQHTRVLERLRDLEAREEACNKKTVQLQKELNEVKRKIS